MASKILIYGGSGGIGSATAKLMVDIGYEVHLVGRDVDRLEALGSELSAGYTAGDVNDPELFSRVAREAGESLAGLIYAVGTINLGRLQRLSEADFLADFRVNAMGAALAVQASLPALKKHKPNSAVVLFSSVAATQGFSLHSSMGMAKGAVNGLTLALAAELAPKVRVNAIAPSLTQTPLAKGFTENEAMAAALAKQHPMKRLGTAEDAARLAVFLVSSQAEWITGQIIGLDGGRSTLQVP